MVFRDLRSHSRLDDGSRSGPRLSSHLMYGLERMTSWYSAQGDQHNLRVRAGPDRRAAIEYSVGLHKAGFLIGA